MSDFHALTLALERWFTTPLGDLPDALRQRVEKEFAPMPCDQLSAEQRRTVALQLDYQQDPTTEQDRQFWWDHDHHQVELKAQIAQWQAACMWAKTPASAWAATASSMPSRQFDLGG